MHWVDIVASRNWMFLAIPLGVWGLIPWCACMRFRGWSGYIASRALMWGMPAGKLFKSPIPRASMLSICRCPITGRSCACCWNIARDYPCLRSRPLQTAPRTCHPFRKMKMGFFRLPKLLVVPGGSCTRRRTYDILYNMYMHISTYYALQHVYICKQVHVM